MKNHTYLLWGIALSAAASAATPSLKENLSEALYTESVVRSPQEAAEMYSKIVESYRNAGSPAELSQHAAAALFRLAEIRDHEGAEEEARKLYREILDRFPNQAPQVRLARQKLGISGFGPRGKITEMSEDEENRELSETVHRTRWNFSRKMQPDELLLTTFEVEQKEGKPNEGLPPGFEVKTLHYAPSGHISKWFSHTRVYRSREEQQKMYDENQANGRDMVILDDRQHYISGFGQTYVIPEELGIHHTGGGSGDSSMAFFFTNKSWTRDKVNGSGDYVQVDSTKWLTVRLVASPLSLERAQMLVASLKMELPEMGDETWSLTLPPSPTELEEKNKGK